MKIDEVKMIFKLLLDRKFTIFHILFSLHRDKVDEFEFVMSLINYYYRSLISPSTQIILETLLLARNLRTTLLNLFATNLSMIAVLSDPLLKKYKKIIKKSLYLMVRRNNKHNNLFELLNYDILRFFDNKMPVFAKWMPKFIAHTLSVLKEKNFVLSNYDVINLFELWLTNILTMVKVFKFTVYVNEYLYEWNFLSESRELEEIKKLLDIEINITNYSDAWKIKSDQEINNSLLYTNKFISLDKESFEYEAAYKIGIYKYFSQQVRLKILSDLLLSKLIQTYKEISKTYYNKELGRWDLQSEPDFDATISSTGTIIYPYIYSNILVEENKGVKEKFSDLKWYLIIDSSGSMSGEKFERACSIARSFVLFAEKVNIKYKIIYFSHIAKIGGREILNLKCQFIGSTTYINSVIDILKKENIKNAQFFIFSDCIWFDPSIKPLINFLSNSEIFIINVSDEVNENYIKEKEGSGIYYLSWDSLLNHKIISRYLFKKLFKN